VGSGRAIGSREAAADAMVQKINEVRARHGLRALRASGSLDQSSRRFAVHLMSQDALYHRARPSTGGGYRRAGEVLAMHTGSRERIGSTVARWMNSSGHRAVLLSRSMGEMGAGIAHGRWGRSRAVVWVVQVGKR
jgi:uncharacterized protein YkwD